MSGRIKCSVVDAKTKRVIREYPWQKNLILNQGLNNFFTAAGWSMMGLRAVAGSGTTPTRDDSGVTTAAQSGTTVTLTGGAFVFTDTGTDAGKMIKWDSGEEAMVVTVTSPTVVEVNTTATIADDEFTVYRTNQTGLTTELKRTATYVAGSNGTDILAPHDIEHYRTYDFTEEVGSVTYNEVGCSHSSTVAANLFMRVLLTVPIGLIAGQQLRLVYRLRVTYSPATPRAITMVCPGWPVAPAVSLDGDEAWEFRDTNIIDSNGNGGASPAKWDFTGIIAGTQFAMLADTTALRATPSTSSINLGNASVFQTSTYTQESYVANSFFRVIAIVAPPAQGNGTTIRALTMGTIPQSPSFIRNSYFRVLLDEAQTKEDTHRLTIRFQMTATRLLQ